MQQFCQVLESIGVDVEYKLSSKGAIQFRRAAFGLAPWSEVAGIVERAGFGTTNDPLQLAYLTTPAPIANWVARIPIIDIGTLEQLRADQILDDELIAAAEESIKRDKDDPSIMTSPSNP